MTTQSLAAVDEKMTRTEAARYLGVSPSLLAVDVVTKRHGFPYYKIGRRVVYSRCQLDAFLRDHSFSIANAAK